MSNKHKETTTVHAQGKERGPHEEDMKSMISFLTPSVKKEQPLATNLANVKKILQQASQIGEMPKPIFDKLLVLKLIALIGAVLF